MSGPFFVSIGDQAKLNKFLELNPEIPRDQAFVDSLDMKVYGTMQFQKFTDVSPEVAKSVKLEAPNMGGVRGWWQYLTNVASLSPVDPTAKPGIPEGVLRLGGTFVVSGEDIVYQWNDRLPGDYPEPAEVWQAVQKRLK